MQGDIMLPGPRRPKAASKPKSITPDEEPQPDFVIDDNLQDKPGRRKIRSPHRHFVRLTAFWRRQGKYEKLATVVAIFLLAGAGALGWFYFKHPQPKPAAIILPVQKPKPKPKPPTTVASPLTGIQIQPALAKRPVTGIMIENSIYARPQSGLQDAGVIYEAIAEGGITRFLALFQEAQPQYIGPVRSLRPYYIDFAAPYQASIVHVGGSPEALSEVRNGSYRDLDQFFNGNYFTRINSRAAPHNVYTSFAKLDALNNAKGYDQSLFTSWPRKADKKLATPTAKSIDFAISGPDYHVHYDYDPSNNVYLRSEGGAPHTDLIDAGGNSVRLQPKVVIALIMGYSLESDYHHSQYQDSGSGSAYVFQDGGLTLGTWEKTDTAGQIAFKDAQGQPLALDAGQTWLTLLGASNMVTYKP